MTIGCFGLLALSLVGCAAEGGEDEGSAARSQDELSTSAPMDMTVTAHLTVGVREALRAAMGEPTPLHDLTDALVPGVLVIRHEFSVERLTLTIPQWHVGAPTEAGPPDVFTPRTDRVELRFGGGAGDSASASRAAAAARAVFDSMTSAQEESTTVGGGGRRIIRRDATGAISCSFEPAHAPFPERSECAIAVHATGIASSN